MKQQTVQRIVWTASYIGLAVDVAAIAIAVSVWSGLSLTGAFFTITATALMVTTLALQFTFINVQMFPNGRAMIPVPRLGRDGWSWVIASTAIPGALWSTLAAVAVPFMRLIMPGFFTPVFMCLLLFIGRDIQLRRMTKVQQ